MKEYIVIVCRRTWINDSGHGFDYTSDMKRFDDRGDAIAHGFKMVDSDDFNVGTVESGRLVAIGWMIDDFTPEDSDLRETARQLCIPAGV